MEPELEEEVVVEPPKPKNSVITSGAIPDNILDLSALLAGACKDGLNQPSHSFNR